MKRLLKTIDKRFFFNIMAVLMMAMFGAITTSCGSDDDEDSSADHHNPSGFDSSMVGKWTGSNKEENGNHIMQIYLYEDQSAYFKYFIVLGGVIDEQDNAKWSYDSSSRKLKIIFPSEGKYISMDILSVTSSTMQLSFMDHIFHMTKASGTGYSGGSGSGSSATNARISISTGSLSYLSHSDEYKVPITVKVSGTTGSDVEYIRLYYGRTSGTHTNQSSSKFTTTHSKTLYLMNGVRWYVRAEAALISTGKVISTEETIDLR